MSRRPADGLEAKMVVLGDTGVGKTCLVVRYVEGRFTAGSMSTIGASFMVKKLTVADVRVTLQIWDTAGQERFRSLAPMYYRGAAAAILVFDVTRRDSFSKVQEWVQELKKHADADCVLAIAGNKTDVPPDQRQVTLDEASTYATTIGALAFDTSAKANKGVDELFLAISKKLVENRKAPVVGPGPQSGGDTRSLGSGDAAGGPDKGKCAC